MADQTWQTMSSRSCCRFTTQLYAVQRSGRAGGAMAPPKIAVAVSIASLSNFEHVKLYVRDQPDGDSVISIAPRQLCIQQ